MQIFHLTGRIALLENKKAELEAEIEKLRNPLPKEKKKKEKKEKAPVASTSKTPKQPKAQAKKKSRKSIADDDVLTFEQKKDLSEAISKLDGSRLERVIQIIHEGVPEIRDVSNHLLSIQFDLKSNRVRRKLNLRLILYQLRYSRSSTTMFSDHCANPHTPSAHVAARVQAQVALSGSPWMKSRRRRRSVSLRSVWRSSRREVFLLLSDQMIVSTRRNRALRVAQRVTRSKSSCVRAVKVLPTFPCTDVLLHICHLSSLFFWLPRSDPLLDLSEEISLVFIYYFVIDVILKYKFYFPEELK